VVKVDVLWIVAYDCWYHGICGVCRDEVKDIAWVDLLIANWTSEGVKEVDIAAAMRTAECDR